ncbi:MAG TPA: hypothetical protein ENG24_00490 [Thermoplasmatales archaeon]|nr:hypothetical protein [Thermoplasmatales archaeon]
MRGSICSKKVFSLFLILLVVLAYLPGGDAAKVSKTKKSVQTLGNNNGFYSKNLAEKAKIEANKRNIRVYKHVDYLEKSVVFREKETIASLNPCCLFAKIHTIYENSIEKDSTIRLFRATKIDVDNKGDADLAAYAKISIDRIDLNFALKISLNLERINDDIMDKALGVYLEISIPALFDKYAMSHRIRIGYESPDGEELPKSVDVFFSFVPFIPFIQSFSPAVELGLEHNGGDNSKIALVADYARLQSDGVDVERKFAIEFDPIVSTTLYFNPGVEDKVWSFKFRRTANEESLVTFYYEVIRYNDEKKVSLTFDKLPKTMNFDLEISPFSSDGGKIEYKSSRKFNIIFSVESNKLGQYACAYLQGLPKHVVATWKPGLDGSLDVEMSSSIEKILVCDNLEKPTVELSISNFPKTVKVLWSLRENGYFEVFTETEKDFELTLSWLFKKINWNITAYMKGLPGKIGLYWTLPVFASSPGQLSIESNGETKIGVWLCNENWKINTGFKINPLTFTISWLIANDGYVAIDSNNQSLVDTYMVFEHAGYRVGTSIGLWKTKDFKVSWHVKPGFKISWSGHLKIVDTLKLWIDHNGNHYEIEGRCELSEDKGDIEFKSKKDVTFEVNALSNTVFKVDLTMQLAGEKNVSISWKKGCTGCISLDTENKEVSSVGFIIYTNGYDFGIKLTSDTLKAMNFEATWDFTHLIPDIDLNGDIYLNGNVDLSVLFNGKWYKIF